MRSSGPRPVVRSNHRPWPIASRVVYTPGPRNDNSTGRLVRGRPCLSGIERRERRDQLLAELGIAHLAGSKAYTLSGGERRRVEIARALTLSPKFILLDEPFAGIDPLAVQDIQGIIWLLKKKGIGVLITDHNVRETLAITDRAYIISEGAIIKAGSAAEIMANPQVRQLYLGEDFRL